MVVENIPHQLAKTLSEILPIPIIGIGAGDQCDGQVQVFHDLFGLFPEMNFHHMVQFVDCGQQMKNAIQTYAKAVRSRQFTSN